MTKQETTASIRKAIDDARAGRATLGQLGIAHDHATSLGLTACVGELRGHIIRMAKASGEVSRPRSMDLLGDVVAGVISGYFTHRLIS